MAPSVDVGAALSFVKHAGDAREQARLKVLLHEELSDDDLEALTSTQNPDGGFRIEQLKGDASIVGETLAQLTWFAALGAGELGTAQAAADFLISNQRADGSWGEPESLRALSPPVWVEPGNEASAVWETASAVTVLRGMGYPLDFRSAAAFLRSKRPLGHSPSGFSFEPFLLYAALRRTEGQDAEITARARAAVEANLPGKLAVWEIVWALLPFALAEVPPKDHLVRRLAQALEGMQLGDRAFAGQDGKPSPMWTVLSLCALEFAGVVRIPRTGERLSDEGDWPEPDKVY